MSKNIPVKNRIAERLDELKQSQGIENYSDLIELLLDKTFPKI